MNFYVHNVPGRLRIKHPMFKSTADHYEIKKALVQMGHGIGTVDFNSTTGSILISYDPVEIKHLDILGSLERAGFYQPEKMITNDQVIHQATSKAFHVMTKAVSGAFLDTALHGTGLSFLTILL